MHTLGDLLSQVRTLDAAVQNLDGNSVLHPSTKIIVPGTAGAAAGGWKLPADPADAAPVLRSGSSPTGLDAAAALQARTHLLNAPSFVAELVPPGEPVLRPLLTDIAARPHHRARAFLFAVAVSCPDGVMFGRAKLVVLEGEPRPGRSTILAYDEAWFGDLHDVAVDLAGHLRELPANTPLRPEPGAGVWVDAVALLGGGRDGEREAPDDWQRRLKITAALYAVHLDVRPDPDSARQKILGDLRSKPPRGLLVWQGWVKAPEVYLSTFRSSRPGAYAECLGVAHPPSRFGEDSDELHMHLATLSPVTTPPADASIDNWKDAAEKIKAMEGDHFRLSDTVRAELHDCPYPNPQRMLDHVTALEQLARAYADRKGVLGGDICKIAIETFHIEIALFDSNLAGTRTVDGVRMDTTPHVKVDDYKDPDECGRIYFAIDSGRGFVVDHIGLHDYT